MRRIALGAVVLVALTGCGQYSLGSTLPEYDDTVGVWRNDDATLTLLDDRRFEITDLPSGTLENYESGGDISGTLTDPGGRPLSLGAYDLYDDAGEFVDTLYFYDGAFEAPAFLFARGVVDDGDWFRFTKDD